MTAAAKRYFGSMESTVVAMLAVVRKDLLTAVRGRHAVAAEVYFIVGAVAVLVFAFPGARLDADMRAGAAWLVLYFAAMMTVARGYLVEQERGTLPYLMHTVPPDAVYWGKLVAGVLWLAAVGIVQYVLMELAALVPFRFDIALVLVAGAGAIGATTSLLAAIVAAARLRNWVFAAIAFPIVMPIFFLGIESLATVLAGGGLDDALTELTVMLLYVVVVVVVAWWLFPFIWSEA
jgi:ABC-type transport system involved in cytochrome c biogenesis permease component